MVYICLVRSWLDLNNFDGGEGIEAKPDSRSVLTLRLNRWDLEATDPWDQRKVLFGKFVDNERAYFRACHVEKSAPIEIGTLYTSR
jgi:hypothetical protein